MEFKIGDIISWCNMTGDIIYITEDVIGIRVMREYDSEWHIVHLKKEWELMLLSRKQKIKKYRVLYELKDTGVLEISAGHYASEDEFNAAWPNRKFLQFLEKTEIEEEYVY